MSTTPHPLCEPSDPIQHAPHNDQPTLADMISQRTSRRDWMRQMTAYAAAAGLTRSTTEAAVKPTPIPDDPRLEFSEVTHGMDQQLHIPPQYQSDVLLRWGDPVLPNAPAFDPYQQTPEGQRKQFGYNPDFIAFLPLPPNSDNNRRGLLCVNHEYTDAQLMFPGFTDENRRQRATKRHVDIERAAHGHTIVEIQRNTDGRWQVALQSRMNRRISSCSTEVRFSGPAAGHRRLRTTADPTGRRGIGTLANCAGGVTPWGTVLISEENLHVYFGGDPAKTTEATNHARYGLGPDEHQFAWHRYYPEFDVEQEPHGPNRYGWVLEFDPYDPQSIPIKRTALGRLRHEGATTTLTADGRVAVYSGDDARFEYLYRFISRDRFNTASRAANSKLLDAGTLSVAQFHPNGKLRWLPLEYGAGPLTAENGFHSQADVLIETRRAADLVGATPLDRPEDVEENPANRRLYVMLTNNSKREAEQVTAESPRAANVHGHILELIAGDTDGQVDHGADEFRWQVFLLGGNPAVPDSDAQFHPQTSPDGWLTCPDNCTFDPWGHLWIATDGAPGTADVADGIFATDTDGPGRALTRHFLRAPRGAELCGPAFTPDGSTFFVAVQHPGEEADSTFDQPSTRWPDFDPALPPRPAVIAIHRRDQRPVGA